MQIAGKVFLVTGAGSGLGAETAKALVAAGGKVVLADLNREAGEKLAAELGAAARFVATDVADEGSAQNAVDTALMVFGGLHGLVNCAGVAPAEKVVGRDGPHRLESFTKVIQINLIGSFNMIRLAAAAMMLAAAAMMTPATMPAFPSGSPFAMAFAPDQILTIPQMNPNMNSTVRARPKPSFNCWIWATKGRA